MGSGPPPIVNDLSTSCPAKIVMEIQTASMSILETTNSVVCNSSILMSLNDGLMLKPNQNLLIIRCEADGPLIVPIEKTWQLKEVGCHLMAASRIYVVRANNVPKILLNSNMKAYCS